MKQAHVIWIGVGCFVLGAITQSALAQSGRPTFSLELVQGKDAATAAAALLDGALYLAEDGSWERIAVGRAWYLGGDKAKGSQIFDSVTHGGGVEGSDWFRIARIYGEAGDWEKAQEAFDRILARNPNDGTAMIEYGALANVHKDRVKAEQLFAKAMARKPRDFWHWVGAGGSYLGVRPQ
jgi:tetratricopeptide (TPR) repeat protein